MYTSEQGKQFLRAQEGLRQKVYPDSGGAPTIGIGHLLTLSERRSGKIIIGLDHVKYAKGLTIPECYALLEQDLVPVNGTVYYYVRVVMTQNQFDALVSFMFNIGKEAFIQSTLLRLLNQGQYGTVPLQMRRWIYDDGVIVQGLINRREKEIGLWQRL